MIPRLASFLLASCTALIALTGCSASAVVSSKLDRPPHELTPRSVEQVELFVGKPPSVRYAEVYLLEGDDGADVDRDEILRQMRAKAGQLGCDGLVLEGGDTSAQQLSPHLVTSASKRRGTCIVYSEPKAP